MATGITADDCRIALASAKAGVRIIEVNHPSVCLSLGLFGVTTMREAEDNRHRLPLEEVIRKVRALRRVVDEDVYISVAVPGLFTEPIPIQLTKDDFVTLSRAGADGLHVHKANWEDLASIVTSAHESGLLVDAYISDSADKDCLGIPADSEADIRDCAAKMERLGVDCIGLMMGHSFKGENSEEFSAKALRRLKVLSDTVSVPVFAEGGITVNNIDSIKSTGAHVAVVGTFLDDAMKRAMTGAIDQLISSDSSQEVVTDE